MSAELLARLEKLQDEINGAYGMWGTNELADASSAAAAVAGFEGNGATLQEMAADCEKAWLQAQKALQVFARLKGAGISQVWAGETHVAANEALDALADDVVRGMFLLKDAGNALTGLGQAIDRNGSSDRSEIPALQDAAARAREMTMLGSLPDVMDYYDADMRETHAAAMAAVGQRVQAHISMRNAGEDFTRTVNGIASQARAGRLASSPLSAIDEVVISDAGDGELDYERVLTAAMNDRAAAAMSAMNDADRRRMTELLAAAGSPEHRAYLMRTLAAGYGMDEVARFNSLVAAHGNDPAWLDSHLSPLSMDGTYEGDPTTNEFQGSPWTQGNHPTCVTSSTLTARAEIDPLYALGLTTGGHPDDPAFDNPQAFAERLLDEQTRVHDDKRTWFQDFSDLVTFDDPGGLTPDQSAELANDQLGSRTGTEYHNVEIRDADARRSTLTSITQAVDEGYPVPLSVREGDSGHQMMIIGHTGDQLQIYNPWGQTFWVSTREFIDGDINAVDPDIPKGPAFVRIPERTGS